jgi:LAS superfamily LD-carboxypeptidase LdcB
VLCRDKIIREVHVRVLSGVKAAARDGENEDLIAQQRNKISELKEQNKQLKQRVILSQQQAQAAQQLKKPATMYEGVPSKIDTVRESILFLPIDRTPI